MGWEKGRIREITDTRQKAGAYSSRDGKRPNEATEGKEKSEAERILRKVGSKMTFVFRCLILLDQLSLAE